MHYSLKVKTPAATEAVTLADAKDFLRIDHSLEDDLITSLVGTAKRLAEQYTQRALVTETYTMGLDRFPLDHSFYFHELGGRVIRLPRSPLISVDEIRYIDTGGTQQIFTDFRTDNISEPARITPSYGVVWPTTQPVVNAVEIDFTAGYSVIPKPIIHALKIMISHFYNHRGMVVTGTIISDVPFSALHALGPYRVATHTGSLLS